MKPLLLAVAVFGLLALSACSSNQTATDSAIASDDQAHWMVALNAEFNTEQRDGTEYVTFSDPSGVELFTERPNRASIEVNGQSVVALWQLFGFSENPPNVAFMVPGNSPVIATLNYPAWTSTDSIRMEVVSSADPIPTGTGAVVIDGSDAVNSQVTDSITQANTKVLGDAPAVASGNLYEQTAQALQNAVDQQTATQEFSQPMTVPTFQPSTINSAAEQILNFNGGQGIPGARTPTD